MVEKHNPKALEIHAKKDAERMKKLAPALWKGTSITTLTKKILQEYKDATHKNKKGNEIHDAKFFKEDLLFDLEDYKKQKKAPKGAQKERFANKFKESFAKEDFNVNKELRALYPKFLERKRQARRKARSAEEQAVINERMAKLRALKKKSPALTELVSNPIIEPIIPIKKTNVTIKKIDYVMRKKPAFVPINERRTAIKLNPQEVQAITGNDALKDTQGINIADVVNPNSSSSQIVDEAGNLVSDFVM